MYIKVKVITKAKREMVEKVSDDHYTLSLKQPAERNLANARVLEIFRERFPHTSVRIISGHHSPGKILSIGE